MAKRKAFLILLVFLMAIALSSCKAVIDEFVEKGNVYSVSFNPGNGSWVDDGSQAIRTGHVRHGGYATDPGAVERWGYSFVGWKINSSTSYYSFENPSPVTRNITCTAEWRPLTIYSDGLGGFKLQYDFENNGLMITGYESCDGFSGDIKGEYYFIDGNHHVVSIGSEAFKYDYKTKFESITLPDTIREVEDRAFYECHAKEIHIPESVLVMGREVFSPAAGVENMTVYLPWKKDEIPSGWVSGWNFFENVEYVYKGDDPSSLR